MTNFDESYIKVYTWMRGTLHLRGTALLVFAAIYGLSDEGTKECCLSEEWLASYLDVSIRSVETSLGNLVKKGLIQQKSGNGRAVRSKFTAMTWERIQSMFKSSKKKKRVKKPKELKEAAPDPVAVEEDSIVAKEEKESVNVLFTGKKEHPAELTVDRKAEKKAAKKEKKTFSSGPFVDKKDTDINAEDETPQAKAWQKFFALHPDISIDGYNGGIPDIDFELLHEKIESTEFLQNRKSFTWFVRNWAKIKEGYYDPYEKPDPWKELLKDETAEQQYPDLGTTITADGVWRNGVFTPYETYEKSKKGDNHIEH